MKDNSICNILDASKAFDFTDHWSVVTFQEVN